MKYIDSERLIAEIERQIEETKSMKPAFDQFWAGQISAFKGVKTIIDTLQQEQQKVELEKVYDAYCKVCGHYAHTTPAHICRHACDYFKDFKALLNARKED